MYSQKISPDEIADIKVSSLPTRPTAPTAFGGRGYTASEMKAAFDMLPLFIIERLNSLISYIKSDPADESIASDILTGISEGHTLSDLFRDIKDGSFADKFTVLGDTLPGVLANIRLDIERVEEKADNATPSFDNLTLDVGSPSDMEEVRAE